MGDEPGTVTGGCLCGAVRYEATGEPLFVGHCHCRSCRRHTGAPVVTLAAFAAERVRFTKQDRKIYNSSPGVRRSFCDDCGTPLTWEGDYAGCSVIDLHISTFDRPDAFVPTVHWHHSKGIAWFDVADDLPRLHGDGDGEQPYCYGPTR